ncbi:unnamed protein product [Lactuca saligna]|uniref:Xyloglucan endotransglucosylase/hydrolase n=1 Tax=Lactuca saligna TaxID=75948 RepID=A0AA36E1X9_LACSI|nr:unnamed protein product [Lactuca saligna]
MLFSTYLPLVILCVITIFIIPSFSLNPSTISFIESFSPLFGYKNVKPSDDGKSVQISMNQWSTSGSGFVSRYAYNHGMFTASIKLPDNNYSAGVVVTFYAQNSDYYRDEIDFEFLGHIAGEEWVLQTNLYGNGSIHRGREERYTLPFDPSTDFHDYGILWNTDWVVFFVDDLAIREVPNVEGMGGDFPSKPMYMYGTIWDGSDWATHKGEYRVDFQQGPFVTGYTKFNIDGCQIDASQSLQTECRRYDMTPDGISENERRRMHEYRAQYMTYSYCYDTDRYPTSLPECEVIGQDMQPIAPPIMVSGASRRFR